MRSFLSMLCLAVAALLLAASVGYAADEPEPGHATDAHAEGDHGHHDDSDLSHGNAGDELDSPAEFKGDLAIWTLVVFIVLLIVLTKFAWKPIMGALDERERVVAENIAAAQRLNDEAAAKLQGYEQQIAGAKEEVREIIERGRREAEAQGAKLVAEAEAVATRERERSLAEIQAAKNDALGELAQKSVDTAVTLAGQIVSRSLSADDHTKLIQDAVEQFPSRN